MSGPLSTPTRSDSSAAGGAAERARDGKRALARATLYSLASLAFRAPTADFPAQLSSRAGREVLLETARALDDADLVAALTEFLAAPPDLQELVARYAAAFGHTARGEAPPYETEYGEDDLFRQPQELADLAGFAEAFGLRLRPDSCERVDHVSCQCEFVAFLARKEAYALDVGDEEMLSGTRRAAALFLQDHLGRFLPAFVHRLQRGGTQGFYARLGRLLLALVRADCARFGVSLGDEQLRIRLPIAASLPVGCSSCGEFAPGGEAEPPEGV